MKSRAELGRLSPPKEPSSASYTKDGISMAENKPVPFVAERWSVATSYSEQHYRVNELAKLWGLGRGTVRLIIKDEPGVIKVKLGRKKINTIYSVPASVARRIHTKLMS
jgi:hypothetical protein